MKLILLITNFFIFSSLTAQKIDSCFVGVYKTLNDYQSNQALHKTNTSAKGCNYKINADGMFKIISKDSVYKFNTDSIYAINLCGAVYRFLSNNELYAPADFYKIEDTTGLVIYTSMFWGGKEFFYSINLTSKIHRLNKSNLTKDFEQNKELLAAFKKLDKDYNNGLESQSKNHKFLINILYNKVLKFYK